jgi:hypothetical protein
LIVLILLLYTTCFNDYKNRHFAHQAVCGHCMFPRT